MSPPSDPNHATEVRTVLPAGALTADGRLAAGSHLPPGTQLGEFVIEDVIGEGGFSIVYRALEPSLDRRVAIKEYMPASLAMRAKGAQIVPRSPAQAETFEIGRRSFVGEAKLLALFDHPSLVRVHRRWEANGTAYMVMPYYTAPTLRTALQKLGQPPTEQWLMRMLTPLMEALQLIHDDRCWHRDIAPDNILLLGSGPLLLDFGAARRVIGDATQALTVMLKPGYAPFEQYSNGPEMPQGPWTDVYALAAVIYYCATGRAPPPAIERFIKDTMKPLSEAAPGRYSDTFCQAIDHALAVPIERRTGSIAQFRAELQGLPFESAPPAAYGGDDDRTIVMARAPLGTGSAALPPSDQTIVAGPASRRSGEPRLDDLLYDQAGASRASDPLGLATLGGTGGTGASPPSGGASDAPVAPAGAAVPRTRPDAAHRATGGGAPPIDADAGGAGGSGGRTAGLIAAFVAVIVLAGAGIWWTVMRGDGAPAPPSVRLPASPPETSPPASDPGRSATLPDPSANAPAAASGPPVTGSPPVAPEAARLPAAEAAAPAIPSSDAAMITAALDAVHRAADASWTVQLTARNDALRIGKDRLQLEIVSQQAGHVYLLLQGTRGQDLALLYPAPGAAGNRIRAGGRMTLPPAGLEWRAEGPPGNDELLVIVAPSPRDFRAAGTRPGDASQEFDLAALRSALATSPGALAGQPAGCKAPPAECARYGAARLSVRELR